jgi:hypothetical protein
MDRAGSMGDTIGREVPDRVGRDAQERIFAETGLQLVDDLEAAAVARQQGHRHRPRALGIVLDPHEPARPAPPSSPELLNTCIIAFRSW